MRRILIEPVAAFLIERSYNNDASRYSSCKEIIRGIEAGGMKVPIAFNPGMITFEEKRTPKPVVIVKGSIENIVDGWNVSETTIRSKTGIPGSILASHQTLVENGYLLADNVMDFRPLRGRRVYGLQIEDQGVQYQFEHVDGTTWQEVLEKIEGVSPKPDFLANMITS